MDTLTIIMPVYNEAGTFETMLQQVLDQNVHGMKKEIIIIESNSTDGTREQVLKYKKGRAKTFILDDKADGEQKLKEYAGKRIGKNQIRIILEPRPQGKGHALKSGFQAATGDIILIQDGDTEYKTSEYPKLTKPILDGKTAFVLGSRHAHGSTWRIRKMHNTVYANIMNFGHWFYTTLFNILYNVQLTDPATMFKVFRRDAMEGINWKGNYFELDWEIVGKLIRKGHKPVEIPVSYASRTTEEGKKIRFLRDGFLVLWAIVSYRIRPL